MFIERRMRTRIAVSCIAVACTAIVGCNGTSSYLDATGAGGREEGILGQWLTVVGSAVVVLVCLAIVLGIARHRGEHNEPAASSGDDDGNDGKASAASGHASRDDVKAGLKWIYFGTAATVVILLVTFVATMETLSAASHPPAPPSLTLDVTGHQWWWEVRYEYDGNPSLDFTTANEVNLPVGQPVRVRLRSADVIHSFWLPQLAGKMDVIPGQMNEMWLEARQPGHSRGTCGEYCGMQHATMAIAVTAQSPAEFLRWAAARRLGAPTPARSNARMGEVVFTRTCGACHAVSGTNALGKVGPDLTHFASRPAIGAGALENTPDNLSRWIQNAPAVKEGVRMPAILLDTAELSAVVTYLETLR
jgi:cytochrome c oxidase subunit 2